MVNLMNRPKTIRRFWIGWAVALGAALLPAVVATLPPVLGPAGRVLVMETFAPFCHQLPAYSPHIGGVQLAAGHRLYGILWGLVLGTVLCLHRWDDVLDRHAALVLGVAAAPMALDWMMDAAGWWGKTPVSRLFTGILFGTAAGYFLARAVVNLFVSHPTESASRQQEATAGTSLLDERDHA